MEIALKDRGTTCHVNLWTISPVVSSCVRIGCKGSTFCAQHACTTREKTFQNNIEFEKTLPVNSRWEKSVWKCSGGAVYIQQNWSTNMHTMPNL